MSVPVAHVGGLIQGPGETNVRIGYKPAATHGMTCACGLGTPNRIVVVPSRSVVIGGKKAARVGDSTSHGGSITKGCATVIIGS